MSNCADKSIIVCGIVRDAERALKHNLPVMEALSNEFASFRMIVFENDSKDGTKEVLRHWQGVMGEKLAVISNDRGAGRTIPSSSNAGVNPFYSSRRISRMVDLRNQYMDYVADNHLDANYLMVIDLDVVDFSLKGILSSFNLGVDWDAVCANCRSLSPKLRRRYHDAYALTEYGDQHNPQTEEKILSLSEKFSSIRPGDAPVRVFSAFGGIAIYKFEAIKGLKYELLFNADSRVEVRCEHFSICAQMAQKGYDKVYINPELEIKYQKLSAKIIFDSIRRRL